MFELMTCVDPPPYEFDDCNICEVEAGAGNADHPSCHNCIEYLSGDPTWANGESESCMGCLEIFQANGAEAAWVSDECTQCAIDKAEAGE